MENFGKMAVLLGGHGRVGEILHGRIRRIGVYRVADYKLFSLLFVLMNNSKIKTGS